MSLPCCTLQAAHFGAFLRWVTKALGLNTGQGNTFKPDGVCYAHQFHYGNAYGIYLLREAARAAYLLHRTPYALPADLLGRLGKGLWALQVYTADFDCPRALAGRIVGAVGTLHKFWNSFILLGALAPDYPVLAPYNLSRIAVRIARLRGSLAPDSSTGWEPAPLRLYADIPEALSGAEAPRPSGSFSFPFSGAQVCPCAPLCLRLCLRPSVYAPQSMPLHLCPSAYAPQSMPLSLCAPAYAPPSMPLCLHPSAYARLPAPLCLCPSVYAP